MIGVLKNTALTQEQKEYVETVESSGEALLDLVNDILDFSKIGTPLHPPRPIFLCGELRPLVTAVPFPVLGPLLAARSRAPY
jgi:signal transduction histidine kinase